MNWKVFIITHEKIRDEYYKIDNDFNNVNWCFVNVSFNKLSKELYDKYDIIDMYNLPNFIPIGKWYAEMEAIYNIYKNNLYEDLDYIGFIHHDYELRTSFNKSNITEQINNAILNYDLIYFSKINYDYNQRILADITQPNTLVGDGVNCYDYIINDYNKYYNTNENIDEYKQKKYKNICSASFYSKEIFIKLMEFMSYIIESKKLNVFDTNHAYRFQGGISERYISVFLDKLKIPYYDLELNHLYLNK